MKPVNLPRILKQKGGSCAAAAVCGLVEYYLYTQGNPTSLDYYKFHEEVSEEYRGNTRIISVLQYAKKYGIPAMNGKKRVKIKSFKAVKAGDVWGYNEPLVVGCDIETGEPFTSRLDKKAYIRRRQQGYHEMVYVGSLGLANSAIKLANSWGKDWGDDGYCYVKRTLQKSNDPFVLDAYKIIL